VFNKIDSLKEEEIVLLKKEQDNRNCIFVSSLKKKDMAHLKEKIWEVLKTRKRIYQ
jgi:50S ribosomal subunit-associated GTPase HflX